MEVENRNRRRGQSKREDHNGIPCRRGCALAATRQKIWQRKRREQKFPVSGILGGAGNRARSTKTICIKAAAVGSLLGKFNQRDPDKRSDHSIEETNK